jgi:hypothetical protein
MNCGDKTGGGNILCTSQQSTNVLSSCACIGHDRNPVFGMMATIQYVLCGGAEESCPGAEEHCWHYVEEQKSLVEEQMSIVVIGDDIAMALDSKSV